MLPLLDFVSSLFPSFSLSLPLVPFSVPFSPLLYRRYAANIWTQLIRAYGRRSIRIRPYIEGTARRNENPFRAT